MRLNEVIEAMEHCLKPMPESLCSSCPTGKQSNNCGVYEAALQFLKLYRKSAKDLLALIEDYRKEIKTIDDQRNPALTWDELHEMEGKPIWVEVLNQTKNPCRWEGQWMIVKDFAQGVYGEYCRMEPNYCTWINTTYGDTWQAYRKERWHADEAGTVS